MCRGLIKCVRTRQDPGGGSLNTETAAIEYFILSPKKEVRNRFSKRHVFQLHKKDEKNCLFII